MMDVMRPALMYIGGRCYRKNPTSAGNQDDDGETRYEDDYYMEDSDDRVYEDEVCDAFTPIEKTESGFRLQLPIASTYFKFIIGKKGETKKRLENETRTQIKIPRAGQEGDLVILGRDRKGVLSAKTRINIMVDLARRKQPFTHFLSFPINSPEIKAGFEDFKANVLRECGEDLGVDGTIFQNPDKLHLTVGTLALMNNAEIDHALHILRQCQLEVVEPILDNIPLLADIRSLEYMNDDPGSVDVLYAQVDLQDGSDRLQMLADRLVDRFVSTGLMVREYDHVKLHVTVMNTLMRKDPTGSSDPHQGEPRSRGAQLDRERESFDARNVLNNFGDYMFGSQHINTVHLSQRYTTGSDGYYACADRLTLP